MDNLSRTFASKEEADEVLNEKLKAAENRRQRRAIMKKHKRNLKKARYLQGSKGAVHTTQHHEAVNCNACQGTGKIKKESKLALPNSMAQHERCVTCMGKGYLVMVSEEVESGK